MSAREIARAVDVARSTVAERLRRADAVGLSWPLSEGLDEETAESLLFPKVEAATKRSVPDWAEVHKQVRARRSPSA